jgi:hypothetical protein
MEPSNALLDLVRAAAVSAIVGLAFVLAPGSAIASPERAPAAATKVIASNHNSPHALAWGPNGELLVSEAGRGGSACFANGNTCVGLTGKVAAIKNGKVTALVKGLFSVSYAGFGVFGSAGIAYFRGRLYDLMGESSNQVPEPTPPDAAVVGYNELGRLLDVTPGRKITQVADPGDYDFAWSYQHIPQHLSKDAPDADPYGLFVDRSGIFLVDAAANTLDEVSPSGSVKVLAFVPSSPGGDRDSVPTCVSQGPDGAVYVGELTAFGNGSGVANIYRWKPATGMKVWLRGFTAISGCGFAPNGDFYVTEMSTAASGPFTGYDAGAVVQITPKLKRTVYGQGYLYDPNGFLAGSDGSIYVANYSISSSYGQVVRLTPR